MSPAPGPARQSSLRLTFRVLGVVAPVAAVVLGAPAVQDLVATADSFEGPTRFWMFFVAIPLLGLSGWCLQAGSAAYLTDGRGLAGIGATVGPGSYCRSRGTRNDADARFCDCSGTTLG